MRGHFFLALERYRKAIIHEHSHPHMPYSNNSCHDPLTGLLKRQLFVDRLKHAMYLSYRDNSKLAVMFLELGNFKNINVNLGHDTGDLLLAEVAQRLMG